MVEQIARSDQERLSLQLTCEARQPRIEDWQRKAEDRFDKIEERPANIEATLVELPKTLLQTILNLILKIREEIVQKLGPDQWQKNARQWWPRSPPFSV